MLPFLQGLRVIFESCLVPHIIVKAAAVSSMAVAQLQDSGTNMTHKIGQWGETDMET